LLDDAVISMSDYIRDRQLAATSRRRDFVLPPMR